MQLQIDSPNKTLFSRSKKNLSQDEWGFALLIMVICSALFMSVVYVQSLLLLPYCASSTCEKVSSRKYWKRSKVEVTVIGHKQLT